MKDLTLASPLTSLPGIGKTRAEAFGRLGVFCVRDLLYHFPRAYENRGDVKTVAEALDGETHALSLVVATEPKTANIRRGMSITKFRAFDGSGTVEILFFNQPYCRDVFSVGGFSITPPRGMSVWIVWRSFPSARSFTVVPAAADPFLRV